VSFTDASSGTISSRWWSSIALLDPPTNGTFPPLLVPSMACPWGPRPLGYPYG
jgi:hypothetical protein